MLPLGFDRVYPCEGRYWVCQASHCAEVRTLQAVAMFELCCAAVSAADVLLQHRRYEGPLLVLDRVTNEILWRSDG